MYQEFSTTRGKWGITIKDDSSKRKKYMEIIRVTMSEHVSGILEQLAKDYKHRNEGETLRLALASYQWYRTKLSEGRIVGGYCEVDGAREMFTGDYQVQALFTSGTIEISLEIPPLTRVSLSQLMDESGSIDISTLIIEAILLLADITKVLKQGMHIIALNQVRNTFIQFEMKDFETIRRMH